MGRKPPRVRGPPVKAIRRSKVAAPAAISFKSMAACMKEAILKCQEFKRAKAKKGEGKKKVKYSEMDKLRRLMARQAASKAKKANQARAKAEARELRLATKGPIKNPGKYRKDKGFWTKDAKAERKAKWDADKQGRLDRKFMREQKSKLKEVQNATSG